MKLIVTGGGTGGHIYPALEVAKYARSQGADVSYFGSLRGQESKAASNAGLPFRGFPSEPLYSLKSIRGFKALVSLIMSRSQAKRALRQVNPDVIFSTGGYAAGPIVAAAKSLGVPYFIHEANSVPGRANLMFARQAQAFTTLFKATERFAPGITCRRVGNPIRKELIAAAGNRRPATDLVLCVGGSQGSAFLNDCVPRAMESLPNLRLLLASGPKNYEATSQRVAQYAWSDQIEVRPYLETHEMLEAYAQSTIVVGRSGSALAEVALFGIPSVLVPLPSAAGDHQLHNAEEFADMNAAVVLPQTQATPETMSESILWWFQAESRIASASDALRSWSLPNATETICGLIQESK